MKTLSQYKNEQMKNPDFAAAYNEFQPEIEIIRAIVDARANANISQKELSERTGIAQAEISRIENGSRNPSIKLLQRLAAGMNMDLRIAFVPRVRQSYPITSSINAGFRFFFARTTICPKSTSISDSSISATVHP